MAAAARQSPTADESVPRRRPRTASPTWWWFQVGGTVALLLAIASTTAGVHSNQSPPVVPTTSSHEDTGTSSSSSDWDFGFAPDSGAPDAAGVASPPVEVDRDAKRVTVKRLWGVPDVSAVVGRPFRLDVPKDAFTGHVERYEAYGPGNSPLPQWVSLLDPKHGRLEGVPGPGDVGELYVTIKAVAPSRKDMDEFELPEMAKDVFVIEVLPSPPWPSSASGKGVCVSPLLVSVVLDADFNHLGAQSRARVVGAAASTFLSVTPGSLLLRSQTREDKPDPSDGSVLAAGPGDASSPMGRNSKRGSVLEWQIGCNGHIWQWKDKDAKGTGKSKGDWREVSGESVAELRRHARDGTLSDTLGLPVIGWRVRRVGADGRPHGAMGREGGRVTRSPSHRVRREWGSGDFENGDDEEDEDGEEELPKMWSEPWDGDYGFEEKTAERVPETRIIPTMASPVFAEPTAATIGSMGDSSHPHRHHHGEGEEEEDEDDDYGLYASVASGRNVLVTSPVPVYGTILPTPVLVPVKPTRFLGLDEDGNSLEASHFDELGGIDATPSLSLMVASSHFAASMSSPSISPSPTLWPTTASATAESSDLTPVVTEPLLPTTSKDSFDDVSSSTLSSVTEESVSSESSFEVLKATSPSRPGIIEEEIIIDPKNFPPTIHHRLRKIPVTAGNPLRYVIPDDIFTDLEDGTTRNLKLNFKTAEGENVPPSSWVQFNPETQEVYALPLEEHVSKWDFIIEAVDSEGASVSDTLEVSVQHHKGRRAFHHEFSLVMQLENKYNFPSDVDWQLRVLDGLRRLFGDDSIVVTTVGHQPASSQGPPYADTLVFSWTNDTLPRTDCPKEDIDKLYKILALNDAGEPSVALKEMLSPEFKVKRVSYKGNGQCEGIGAGEEATPPISKQVPKGSGDRGKDAPKVPPALTPKAPNTAPVLRNQVDHINATIGKLLVFKVPEDTFFDEEDGSTRSLELSLLTMDRTPIPQNHWLQFDQRNQEFFGIPFNQDKGMKEYQLVCKDSGGLSAHDGLVVAVHDIPAITASTRRRPPLPNQQLPTAHSFHSVEFVATLAEDHEKFDSSPSLKRKFVERLAHLFGDRDTSAILLYSITAGEDDGVAEDGERGTTLISWFNTSLAVDRCPNKDVSRLRNILVAENGGPGMKEVSLSQHVQTTFGYELPIRSIDIIPINTCLGELPVIHFPESPPSILEEDEDERRDNGPSSTTSSSSDEYLITFIVPAVVIASMLLLAGLIACVLYRRRRRGKLSVAEKRAGGIGGGPLLAGANRGIPVIFQDELEERPPDPAKSPVIMKDEKPPLPLPPPEYQMAPNGAGTVGGGTRGVPPGGGGMMAEPHSGTPLLSQGPRHHGSGGGGSGGGGGMGGGPRRRGRGRDDGPGGMMMHGGDEDGGERGALMGGGGGRGGGMGMREDEGADDDSDRGMVPVGGASSPPYHPPPPFTTNRDSGRGSRPKPTPTYRKPPPYVPP
ncbi:dystroglycan 1 [Ischnura elegans]|uniref:dystroglycan 1 n=1 Tax=Ischnura elegans TaxID=197161 RepID=UPI001ED8900B|nr:dystroglycan 1 [Ischnura elegans]